MFNYQIVFQLFANGKKKESNIVFVGCTKDDVELTFSRCCEILENSDLEFELLSLSYQPVKNEENETSKKNK